MNNAAAPSRLTAFEDDFELATQWDGVTDDHSTESSRAAILPYAMKEGTSKKRGFEKGPVSSGSTHHSSTFLLATDL